MKPFKRADRVSNLLKEIVAATLTRLGELPQVYFTTVRLTPDLKEATVLFRMLQEPTEEEITKVEQRLTGLRSRFHEEIRKNLVMRNLPRLSFRYDLGQTHANRIEEVLRELHLGGPDADGDPSDQDR
jgi:ribosome-binding factor A